LNQFHIASLFRRREFGCLPYGKSNADDDFCYSAGNPADPASGAAFQHAPERNTDGASVTIL